MKKIALALALLAVLLTATSTSTSAGGWTVTTLDELPTQVVTNEPLTLGFTVRQHGRTPWVCNCVEVQAFHPAGEKLKVAATMDKPGHYTVQLTFPKPGAWEWSISSGMYPPYQPMPVLVVADAADLERALGAAADAKQRALGAQSSIQTFNLPFALGLIGLVTSGGGLIYWAKKQRS